MQLYNLTLKDAIDLGRVVDFPPLLSTGESALWVLDRGIQVIN